MYRMLTLLILCRTVALFKHAKLQLKPRSEPSSGIQLYSDHVCQATLSKVLTFK